MDLSRFKVDYNVTRSFPWIWYGPTVYSALVILTPLLLVINVALAGYETKVVFKSDFNAQDTNHWYYKFMPVHKQKQLCDKHLFSIGDQFVTSSGIFAWSIETIDKSNTDGQGQGLSYNGSALNDCNLETVFMNMDRRDWTMDIGAVMVCPLGDEEQNNTAVMHARTNIQMSLLAAKGSHILGNLRSVHAASGQVQKAVGSDRNTAANQKFSSASGSDDKGLTIEGLMYLAYQDYFWKASEDNRTFAPQILSIEVNSTTQCNSAALPCAYEPANFSAAYESSLDADNLFRFFDPLDPEDASRISEVYTDVIVNILQLIHAAVALDTSAPLPSNILTNSSAVNQTLSPDISYDFSGTSDSTSDSDLFASLFVSYLNNQSALQDNGVQYPLNSSQTAATIQVEYLCRFQEPKSAGSAAVAVIAATVSMFSSGWAALMIVSTFFLNRQNKFAMKRDGQSFEPVDSGSKPELSYNNGTSSWGGSGNQYTPVRRNSPPPS